MNKQASKQPNKQTNKQANKQTLHTYIAYIPAEPQKAVAEVSEYETYRRRARFLRITDGRANPLMDEKVVAVVPFFGMVAIVAVVTCSVTSSITAGCSVM